jgi:hypothetical protein
MSLVEAQDFAAATGDGGMNAYECPVCATYHIGHDRGGRRDFG